MDDAAKEIILQEKLSQIDNIFIVLSGKGGVGKSTVAVNLTLSLAMLGFKTGIMDVDIHGPSIPKLLGLAGRKPGVKDDEILPIECYANVKAVSMGFLLDSHDQAVIWRGPVKAGMIRNFIDTVAWGKLDYLVVDCPPGTGDEPLSVGQLLGSKARAVIVTTPQQLATIDVEKCITFCQQLKIPIGGIVENMSGYICAHCGKETDIFSSGGGEELALRYGVPFLGRVPIDPQIVKSGDAGEPYMYSYSKTDTAKRFESIAETLLKTETVKAGGNLPQEKNNNGGAEASNTKKENTMKFAVPTSQGKLCAHFGHCEAFALMETDASGNILSETYVTPPPHEPGLLPPWIAGQGVDCVIAGGMGARAQQIFAENGVRVVTGAQGEYPKEIVENYLRGSLVTGANTCDH